MLSDTMKEVNKAESKAKKILQEADAKAAEIVEDAKEQAKQLVADAQNAARAEAKAAMTEAQQEGDEQKSRYAAGLKEQLEQSKAQALEKSDAAVEAVIAGLV